MTGIVVAGGGAYGQAIAHVLATNDHGVRIFSRDSETVGKINRREQNERLPEANFEGLPVKAKDDLEQIANHGSVLFVSATSGTMREAAQNLAAADVQQKYVVSLTKGFEPDSYKFMTEVLEEELGTRKYFAVAGPSLARDIATGNSEGQGVHVGGDKNGYISSLLRNSLFAAEPVDDVESVQTKGGMKNVYAIAAGIAHGLNEDVREEIIERALVEVSEVVRARGGSDSHTDRDWSGREDLLLTTTPASRNYLWGVLRAQDPEAAEEQLKHTTLEGIATLRAVPYFENEFGISLPLGHAVYEMVHENAEVRNPLELLVA